MTAAIIDSANRLLTNIVMCMHIMPAIENIDAEEISMSSRTFLDLLVTFILNTSVSYFDEKDINILLTVANTIVQFYLAGHRELRVKILSNQNWTRYISDMT